MQRVAHMISTTAVAKWHVVYIAESSAICGCGCMSECRSILSLKLLLIIAPDKNRPAAKTPLTILRCGLYGAQTRGLQREKCRAGCGTPYFMWSGRIMGLSPVVVWAQLMHATKQR
eukprot:278672-Amphidinium_carterae.1